MSTIAYGDQCLTEAEKCMPCPPDMCGCEPECEDECSCGPHAAKTRARDAIQVRRCELERWFSLKEWGCKGHPIPAVINCIEMVLRRKCSCHEVGRLKPVRATGDGAVQFRWPKHFLHGKGGYYEGDIIINGCEQHTVLLMLTDNDAVIIDSGAIEDPYPCRDLCGDGCSCYAAPDGEPESPAVCHNEGCSTC